MAKPIASYPAIPKFRLYSGIVLGILFTATFYQFAILLMDLLRFWTMDSYYQVWPLNENEHQYYRLFYAGLASIGGLGVCFEVWFYRAFTFAKKPFFARSRIYNDHRMLHWSFLFWFLKMGFLYAMVFDGRYFGIHNYLNFYQDYPWLFPLILGVLYLNIWKTLLTVYRRKGFYYLILSAFALSILSWGLSRWELVNTKKIEKQLIAKNPYQRFEIEMVPSDYGALLFENKRVLQEFFLVPPKADGVMQIYSSQKRELLPVEEFVKYAREENYFKPYYTNAWPYTQWVFDKEMKLGLFMQLQPRLPAFISQKAFYLKVQHMSGRADAPYFFPVWFYGPPALDPTVPVPPPPLALPIEEHRVKPAGDGKVYFDGELVSLPMLEILIASEQENKNAFHFKFIAWEDQSFQNLFTVLEALRDGLDRYQTEQGLNHTLALRIRLEYAEDSTKTTYR